MILQFLINNSRIKAKKITLFIVAVIEMLLIAYLDYSLGKDLNLFVLFLIPSIFAVWYIGLRCGFFFAVLSVLIAFVSDLTLRTNVAVWVLAVNGLIRLAAFGIIVIGLHTIKKQNALLKQTTLVDPLSGIGNKRAAFADGVDKIDGMRQNNIPLTILFIDLDNFKSVNDIYGHDAGDKLIISVGNILKKHIRDSDTIARIGGDEFIAILYGADEKGAFIVAEKIRSTLEANFKQQNYNVTASIGAATFLSPPSSFEYALKKADSLMYEAKNSSKNTIISKTFQ